MPATKSKFAEVLVKREKEIFDRWVKSQAADGRRTSAAEQHDTASKGRDFMDALKVAAQTESLINISGSGWARVKDILTDLSASRAKNGYTPAETATFVFSLKPPVLETLRNEFGTNADALVDATIEASGLLDQLGLFTMEAFQENA